MKVLGLRFLAPAAFCKTPTIRRSPYITQTAKVANPANKTCNTKVPKQTTRLQMLHIQNPSFIGNVLPSCNCTSPNPLHLLSIGREKFTILTNFHQHSLFFKNSTSHALDPHHQPQLVRQCLGKPPSNRLRPAQLHLALLYGSFISSSRDHRPRDSGTL